MRIGFDVSALVKEAAGIGQCIINIIDNIMDIDTENEYFLFTYDKIKLPFSLKKNWSIVDYGGAKHKQIRYFTALPQILKKMKIEVFFGTRHYLPPFNSRIRYVALVHDLIPLRMPELFTKKHLQRFKIFTAICKHQADSYIAVSEATKADILDYMKIPEEKIQVIYEGASTNFTPERDEAGIKETMERFSIEGDYLLCLSTVEPRKNMLRTIQAYEQYVLKNELPYKLVIVGGKGWNNGEIYDYVKEHNLSGNVIFTGYVSNEDVKNIYAGATVFIYASLYEGFGIPVLEAMQSGVPVITSNVSSMPEVAGDACILVDPYQVDEIKNAIIKVLDSKELQNEMRRKGITQAKKFSWRKFSEAVHHHLLYGPTPGN